MQINQYVKAKVVEVLEDGSIIMSFDGQLIRVVNQSARSYQPHEWVKLRIKKLRPLEFQLT